MYVVEATPIRDTLSGGALDKSTTIYLDAEVWFEPYIDTDDQKGHCGVRTSTGWPTATGRCPMRGWDLSVQA